MGSVTALAEFLSVSAKGGELGKDDTVVFWGHGGGWRGAVMNMPFRLRGEEFTFLRAEASKRISLWTESHFLEIIAHRLDDSHIQPREMRKAFTGHKVGLIAFNSCLMANLEVCYDLRDAADAVVASIDYLDEDEWSIPDWLASAAGKVSVELGKALIENVKSATPYGISRAISLIDTSKMKSVKLALDDFCRHVLLQSPSERVHRTKARKDALLFGKTYATTVDIHEYFLRLSILDKNESFVRYVLAQVQASVIKKACVGPSYVGHPEIGGLTIFFPDSCTAARETYGYNRMLYHKDADSASTFIEESLWRNFLEWYWQDTCPAIT
ncbi:MAG: clostripain-related cysteine peptidase [Burkholderiales bacterium]|nr:clostripain-related cysteine peptidase [Burkholderiales bacterium]